MNTINTITRRSKRCHRTLCRALFIIAFSFLLTPIVSGASETQSLSALQLIAEKFITQEVNNADGEVKVSVSALDTRLRLSDCSNALQAFLPTGSRLEGNTTVGIKCTDPQKYWTVYVSAKVEIYKPIVVATRPIERGHAISESDITTQIREISTLRASYYKEPEQVVGKVTTRRIAIGAPISSGVINNPALVKKGEQVIIIGTINAIEIRTSGKALASGKQGDVIRVVNTNSNRIIEGKVTSEGTVQVRI